MGETSGERRVRRVSKKVWPFSLCARKDTSPSDNRVNLGNEIPCLTPQKKKKRSTGPQKMTLINGVSQTACPSGTFMEHWTVKKCSFAFMRLKYGGGFH